jgi:type I restriction enzyme S subunit
MSCIGNAAFANREVAFNQQINAVIPFSNINPYFLYTQILLLKKSIQSVSTNAMKGIVNKGNFQEIKSLLPPQNLRDKFGQIFVDYLRFFDNQSLASQKLEKLFQTILYRAFSGELTAEWREAHMTELLQEMEHQTKALNLQPTLF